jgi:DNA primase
MNSNVDKIKERLSIVDVISSYLTVEKAGKNYKAKCPFHNEKTPSFFISPDRGTYYCFGCGEKGDIFSFVEKFEGIDFLGSLKLLAERAGVDISFSKNRTSRDEKEIYYEIMEKAASFFEKEFSKNPEARSYLINRGLSDKTIESFRIGYTPNVWRSVSDYLLKIGYKKKDLEIMGLIKTKDISVSENNFYDRFRGRIMFPISDSSGRVIAFSGRIFAISDEANKSSYEEAKYLNSPDTPLFNKSNVLFGIDKAKSSIRNRGYSIVVEGQMDLIMSHQAGFTNTIAVSGTAFTDSVVDDSSNYDNNESKINNLGLIRRLSQNIIFAYDGDEAGIRAASRSAMIALSLDMQVKIAIMPAGKDPADIILENIDNWKDIIKNSVNIISFHIDRICKNTSDIRQRGRQIKEIIFPFLAMVRSAIERSAYITEIHSRTGLNESAIIKDFEVYENTHSAKEIENKEINNTANNVLSRRDYLEQRLFGIIFWQNGNKDEMNILELCRPFEESIGNDLFQNMLNKHKTNADTLAFQAEMWYGSETGALASDIGEIVLNLEEEILNEQKLLLQPLDTEEKLIKFNEIAKRIEEIRHNRSL